MILAANRVKVTGRSAGGKHLLAQSSPATQDRIEASRQPSQQQTQKPAADKPDPAEGYRQRRRIPRKTSRPSAIAASAKASIFIRWRSEIALGKGLAQEVERSSKLIDDPVVMEYVNRVGQNLVRNSDARVPFTIKVIDSDVVNAFALPGGFFYVNSGLILRAQEESELAGVMAHEISHVTARHGTKQATKGELMQLAIHPSDFAGTGRLGRLWNLSSHATGNSLFLPEVFARRRTRSGFSGPAIYVQGRIRSQRLS